MCDLRGFDAEFAEVSSFWLLERQLYGVPFQVCLSKQCQSHNYPLVSMPKSGGCSAPKPFDKNFLFCVGSIGKLVLWVKRKGVATYGASGLWYGGCGFECLSKVMIGVFQKPQNLFTLAKNTDLTIFRSSGLF